MRSRTRRPDVSLSRDRASSTILSRIVLTLGSRQTVVLLRVIAAVAVIATIVILTRVMFWLPWEIDGGMTICVAGGWTLWLHNQEHRE